MSLKSWIGRKIGLKDAGFWTAYYGGGTWAGKSVTIDSSLQISTWWSCVRLIAETIATLPLSVYENGENGARNTRRDHPLYELLHDSPNADQTAVEFWEGMVAGLCIVGNSYAEKVTAGNRLIALQPMGCDSVRPYRNSDGDLRYRVNDRGKSEDFPEDKIFHLKGFGTGGDMGLSPIGSARQTLGIAIATEEATGRTFSNGLRASGFMMFPQTLDKNQRKQARENLIKPLEGVENEGKTGILEAGVTWKPTNIPPKDAEMLLTRRFNVEEICRFLRVPPILIGHAGEGQTMWGTGVEQIMIAWLTLGLRPYLTRIEQSIKKRLIQPTERGRIYAEFAVEGLLRGDSASRAAFMSSMAQNGFLSRNEGRALDNRPPLPGGDVLTVQSNLIPLTQLVHNGGPPLEE